MNRDKVYELLKKVNNYKWNAFDNKYSIASTFRAWIDEVELLCKEEEIALEDIKHDISEERKQDFIHYLNFSAKEGFIDEEIAEEMIKNKEWDKIERMMDEADARADAQTKGEQ